MLKPENYTVWAIKAEVILNTQSLWEATLPADDAAIDVGIGLRYDYGKFYASKTFYDPAKKRRVLWGWVGETDSERADVAKGWAGIQVANHIISYAGVRSNQKTFMCTTHAWSQLSV